MKILITESHYKTILSETRSVLDYLIMKSKQISGIDWPKYVIKDWLYKKDNDVKGMLSLVNWFTDNFGYGHWEYRVINASFDVFTDDTQDLLVTKMGGKLYDFVPNDEERHNRQRDNLEKNGVSSEPIILFLETNGKYELLEGWHRTTQALKKFENYKQNAWVYIVE